MITPKKLVAKMNRPAPDTQVRSGIFRFDKNERATVFSDQEFKDMLATLTPLDFVGYGEVEPLYDRIVKWLGVKRGEILLASGSDSSIRSIYETYIEPGDDVAILVPTYAMFQAYAQLFGANVIELTYNHDLTVDVDKLIEKITPKTKLLVIANPNHTGTALSEEDLLKIVRACEKNNTIALVDEAYHHFYPHTFYRRINEIDNLIVARTFSKAFGLASLRIGLLISNEKIISDLYRVKLVHEITGTAAKIGAYLLDHMEIVEKYVDEVNRSKEILYKKLPEIGFDVLRSEANFVFFKHTKPLDGKKVVEALAQKNFFIKGPFSNMPFSGHLRVTVGDPGQMNLFIDQLKAIVTGLT